MIHAVFRLSTEKKVLLLGVNGGEPFHQWSYFFSPKSIVNECKDKVGEL